MTKKENKLATILPLTAEKLPAFLHVFYPSEVIDLANKEIEKGISQISPETSLYKAITLTEFENGILATDCVSEPYKTFVVDLSSKIQTEYGCKTTSQKATAELVAINYVRTLQTQRKITKYLNSGSITDIGVGYLNFLSKELDRANRHYLTAIQTLQLMKQPAFRVNVNAQTAVVGQNQIIQANNHE